MTTAEPFRPNRHARNDRPAAADPGQGAPPPAEGYGPTAGKPDVVVPEGDDSDE
ncbi:MAG TPA: hypothetical protein VHU62_09895 [Mycobacterium sp.]|nr:hypothetical protein [Mycobacterium sp.]